MFIIWLQKAPYHNQIHHIPCSSRVGGYRLSVHLCSSRQVHPSHNEIVPIHIHLDRDNEKIKRIELIFTEITESNQFWNAIKEVGPIEGISRNFTNERPLRNRKDNKNKQTKRKKKHLNCNISFFKCNVTRLFWMTGKSTGRMPLTNIYIFLVLY